MSKIFQGNVRQENMGEKFYFVYLGFFGSVFSGWHLNDYFGVNGVLHNPMAQSLKKKLHILSVKDAKKFVLTLLEHQCTH